MKLSPLETRTVPGRFAAALERDPAAPFLVGPGVRSSYAETEATLAAAAAALSSAGVGKGTRVAILHERDPRYPVLLLALARLGAVAVTLNVETREQLLDYYLADSGAELLLVDRAHADSRPPDRGAGPRVVELADGEDWPAAIADPARPPQAAGDAEVAFHDPFVVVYTSGSTGDPKGVEISHAQAVTCGEIFALQLGLGPADRLYTCLPFFHINATNYSLCGALHVGASLAVGPRFSARRFWRDVAELGATQVNAMGSMLKILESQEPGPAERDHDVRAVFVAPLPVEASSLAERFGVEFSTTYAQTEWLPSALSKPGEGYGLEGFAGPVLPFSEVQVVDEADRPRANGEVGEIVLRAHEPYVAFGGYLGKPEQTVEAFRNLRFHTGDRGEIDERGRLYFRGRTKDVIRRRGENIAAPMVEELMTSHPQVVEAAAVPVPSELLEDEVFVYVQVAQGSDLRPPELLDHSRNVMPRYMVPLYIEVVSELPRTATNKIAKAELAGRARSAVESGRAAPLWGRA